MSTRWGWKKSTNRQQSGWMTKKQFQDYYRTNWEEQWQTAEPDEMPNEKQFEEFYGKSKYLKHWKWHHTDDTSEEEEEEQKNEVGVKTKRKRVAISVWSPKAEPVRKRKKSSKSSSSSSSSTDNNHTHAQHRERNDAYKKFRTKCLRDSSKVAFHQQYLLAHLSDSKSKDSNAALRDERGMAIARAHICWGKHALRCNILELLSINRHQKPLSNEHFDADGIDAHLIECSACSSSSCCDGNDILLCDGPCQRAFHQNCLEPKLETKDIPEGDNDWWCHQCDALLDCMDMISERLEIKLFWENKNVSYDSIRCSFLSDISVSRGRHEQAVPNYVPSDMINVAVCRKVKANALRIDVQGVIRSYDPKNQKYLVVYQDGVEQELTMQDIELTLRRADIGMYHVGDGSSSSSSSSSGTILDMEFDEMDDSEYSGNSGDSGDSGDSNDSDDASDSDSDDSDSDDKDSEDNDSKDTKDETAEAEDAEEDNTRWCWLPHTGSQESGWMDATAFQKHYGDAWQQHWNSAEQNKMPKKSQFKQYYGKRVWKRHYNWHNDDDEDTLLSTRTTRERNVVDYEVLLSALQDEQNDYGDGENEQTWQEGMKPESPNDEEDGNEEDEDWSA